jgi:hypothetical protein
MLHRAAEVGYLYHVLNRATLRSIRQSIGRSRPAPPRPADSPTAPRHSRERWINPSRASRLGVSPSPAAKSRAKAQSPPKKLHAAPLTTVPLVWYTGDHTRCPAHSCAAGHCCLAIRIPLSHGCTSAHWFELSVSLSARCAAAAFVSSTPGTPRTINPRNRGVFACHARFVLHRLRHFVRLFSRISSPLPGQAAILRVKRLAPAKTRPRKFSPPRFS